MPGQPNMMDGIADDIAVWLDKTADEVATGLAPGRAPFSANITEDQKLQFYKDRLFNPDGSPNAAGRNAEIARLGAEGFGHVLQAVVRRWPDLKPPEEDFSIPEEWPRAAPGPPAGAMPPGPPVPVGAPPGAPVGPPPGPPGPPGPMPMPPRPPMMPPIAAR